MPSAILLVECSRGSTPLARLDAALPAAAAGAGDSAPLDTFSPARLLPSGLAATAFATASAATVTTRRLGLGARFVHGQVATAERIVVELADGGIRLLISSH